MIYDNEKFDAKDFVSEFTLEYYKLIISQYGKRISNILNGRGDCLDGYVFISPGLLTTQKEREKAVGALKKSMQRATEELEQVKNAISAVKSGMSLLENVAEERTLRYAVSNVLRDCFYKYDFENKKRLPSEMYDAIFVHPLFKSLRSKYRKAFGKEGRKIDKSDIKIKKDLYDKLRELQYKKVIEKRDEYSNSWFHSGNPRDYRTMDAELKTRSTFFQEFEDDLIKYYDDHYSFSNEEQLEELHVDVQKLSRARALAKGEEKVAGNIFNDMIDSFEYISENNVPISRIKDFYDLKEIIVTANRITVENVCLHFIIDAFKNTTLRGIEFMEILEDIYHKQVNKSHNIVDKAAEAYEKSGVKELVAAHMRLVEAFKNTGIYRYQVSELEKKGASFKLDLEEAIALYRGACSEMLSILLKYPELNKPEYGIDLSRFKNAQKVEEVSLESRDEMLPSNVETLSVSEIGVEQLEVPVNVVTVGKEELEKDLGVEQGDVSVPVVEVGIDELKKDLGVVEANNDVTLETEQFVDVQIPYEYSDVRTALYSKYMVEKVKNSELGKVMFSNYLEQVAPQLVELIELEKQREQQANTIFKNYILYLSSLEDKTKAMSFSEFTAVKYNLDPSSLPYEFSNEEIAKRMN